MSAKPSHRIWHDVTRQLACLHCGETYAPAFPLSLGMLGVIMGQFNKEHRRCKLDARGVALKERLVVAWEAAGSPAGVTLDVVHRPDATIGERLAHDLTMRRLADETLPDGVTVTKRDAALAKSRGETP